MTPPIKSSFRRRRRHHLCLDGPAAQPASWTDTDNWSGGATFPQTNDDAAVINTSTDAITTGASRTIGSLELGSSFGGSLTLSGSLTLDSAGALSGDLSVGAGTFDVADQAASIDGQTALTGGAIQTGTGIVTFGDGSGDDSVTVSNGTLVIESDATTSDIVLSLGSGSWTNSGGTIRYAMSSGTSTLLSSLSAYYDLDINASGCTYRLDGAIDINANLLVTAGELNTTSAAVTASTWAATSPSTTG